MILPVTEDIFWIGALNPDLRLFDVVVETKFGTTYNSYLIKADKVAIVETVKETFADEYINKVKQLVDPANIDYIVLNHTEPDHSSALGKLLDVAPNATVVASLTGIKFLKAILNRDFKHIVAKDGDELSLGNRALRFISAPFLHWPDTMFTYVPEEELLFTCDAFGCHYCHEKMFNDEVPDFSEALQTYFDSIVSPFKDKVLEAIAKIEQRDIAYKIICPGHGPILRSDPGKTVETYRQWSQGKTFERKRVFVGYVSAYGNTRLLAEAIAAGAQQTGSVDVILKEMSDFPEIEILQEIEDADGVAIGTPTFNRDALLPVWELMAKVSAYRSKGKQGLVFGSYGWSGEAVGMISDRFKGLGFKLIHDGLRVNFRPTEEELAQAVALGEQLAEAANLHK